MHELTTAIDINATPERVWSTVIDFPSYPQWNPFIRLADGDLKVGGRLKTFMQPSGTKGIGFRPTVLVFEPNRELRWIGYLFFSFLFAGNHRFVIEPLPGGKARLLHSEIFTGLLVPFMRTGLERDTRRGFLDMNTALKKRAEGL